MYVRVQHWHQGFRDLLDLPRVTPVLEEIYAGDRVDANMPEEVPAFRIDHINVHTHGAFNPDLAGTSIHGGNQLLGPRSRSDCGEGGVPETLMSTYYHKDPAGRLHNGLVSVTFELEDTYCNDGGFCCLPVSGE